MPACGTGRSQAAGRRMSVPSCRAKRLPVVSAAKEGWGHSFSLLEQENYVQPFRQFDSDSLRVLSEASYLDFGRFAPYLERACIRPWTPWVSNVPRMMW